MPRVKKITDSQFFDDVISYEVKKYGIDFNYLKNLPKRPKNNEDVDPDIEYQDDWFSRYCFDSFDEFKDWREYFYNRYKDWKSKSEWKKRDVENCFEGFNFMYGLKTAYEYDHELYKQAKDDIYKKVFGKNK